MIHVKCTTHRLYMLCTLLCPLVMAKDKGECPIATMLTLAPPPSNSSTMAGITHNNYKLHTCTHVNDYDINCVHYSAMTTSTTLLKVRTLSLRYIRNDVCRLLEIKVVSSNNETLLSFSCSMRALVRIVKFYKQRNQKSLIV